MSCHGLLRVFEFLHVGAFHNSKWRDNAGVSYVHRTCIHLQTLTVYAVNTVHAFFSRRLLTWSIPRTNIVLSCPVEDELYLGLSHQLPQINIIDA